MQCIRLVKECLGMCSFHPDFFLLLFLLNSWLRRSWLKTLTRAQGRDKRHTRRSWFKHFAHILLMDFLLKSKNWLIDLLFVKSKIVAGILQQFIYFVRQLVFLIYICVCVRRLHVKSIKLSMFSWGRSPQSTVFPSQWYHHSSGQIDT